MKTPLLQTAAFCILMFFLSSCSNPLNKKFNENSFGDDLKEIAKSKKVDTTEARYIAMYIVRAKMIGVKLDGKTYQDILDSVKIIQKQNEKEEAEQKALAQKEAQEEKLKSERFNKAITVALFNKGYQEGDFQNYITYDVAFQNKSNKEIRAVKGVLVITDLFDTKIKGLNITMDTNIPANSTLKESYQTEYNQFVDEDVALKSKEMKDLKSSFVPEKIIFADGSTLE